MYHNTNSEPEPQAVPWRHLAVTNEPSVWHPAEQFAPELLDHLMYMATGTAGDIVVQQYKHADTRRYLNLDANGRAWQVTVTADGDATALPIDLTQAKARILS